MQGAATNINGTFIIQHIDLWLRAERTRLRALARFLNETEYDFLAGYFFPQTLASVRVLTTPDLSMVEPPPQYFEIMGADMPPPIDFMRIRGLTLMDTIVMASDRIADEDIWRRTLFQECVHVCQFKRLGSTEFLSQYLTSWWEKGCRHDDIPLEHQAATLMLQAATQPDSKFSVELTLAGMVPASYGE